MSNDPTTETEHPTPAPESDDQNPVANTESVQKTDEPTETPEAAAETDATKPAYREKIQIGSRKSVDKSEPAPSKPLLAGAAFKEHVETLMKGPDKPAGKVPTPSVRDKLSADLEQEIAAALGGASVEDLVSGSAPMAAADEIEIDTKRPATVVRIHGDNVFFSLGGRNEGVASLREFKEEPSIGDNMEVAVTRFNNDDGLYELKVAGSAVNVQDWSDIVEGTVVEARITGSNSGGLECTVGNIRGFIPASQIAMYRVEDFEEFHDQKLPCVITEANERRGNLVLSARALAEREREEKREQLLESMAVGDVMDGVVSNVRDFGAFVDLGGIDGLVHISKLSWDRVAHPSEVLEEGQKVRVKIEKVDPQTGKISLSYRDLLDHPWTGADAKFPVGTSVRGVVTRVAKFGAFVRVAPGIEGLVHISELAHHRVVQVTNVVNEGDEVEVKIVSVDPQNQRMALSIKAAQPVPESVNQQAKDDEPDEPPREMAVPKRKGPLKGGTSRPSGGDQFGLNW